MPSDAAVCAATLPAVELCGGSQQVGDRRHRLCGHSLCTLVLTRTDRPGPKRGATKTKRESAIMAYVITDTCTKDELCVEACPTDCIHPKKDEDGFEAETQLYVDPEGCIDCGACVPVCPSNSMFLVDEVPADKQEFIAKNAAHYGK